VRLQQQRQVLSHSGAVSGFNTWNGFIPSTRSAVVLTCNQDGGLGDLPGQVLNLLLHRTVAVPTVQGPGIEETVRTSFAELQQGKVDPTRYSDEFNAYLTAARLAGAAERLQPYGNPSRIEILGTHERGGMEVSRTRLHFQERTLRSLMYRRPEGIIEQFFIEKDSI
jgi:hypothetical protein